MREWFHRILQVSAFLALLAVAFQGGAVCAGGELAAGHAMTAVAMAHGDAMAKSDHGSVNGHPTDSGMCKQLCLSVAIMPFAGQERIDFPRVAAQHLTDKTDMPSLRPELIDRPPKSMV